MTPSLPLKKPFSGPRAESQLPDSKPLYSKTEAEMEASRCLYCYDAPCIKACPTAIDIPGFIKKIATGNIRGSARTILSANMLGYSCARVCPVEVLCAGTCVYNHLDETPIRIGRLQRYATEKALEQEASTGVKLFEPKPPIGKKVALIGAGPASLACAAHLALEGVETTLFEKNDLPGGLNTSGVAPYKLHSEDALSEVQWLLNHGVTLRTGVRVGKDLSFDRLRGDFDAVFIGTGLGQDNSLDLPGAEGPGVWGATALIRELKNNPDFRIPDRVRKVVVIGAGNTAIDIARELAMLGVAKVIMAYRSTQKKMSGYHHEMDQARKYGVGLVENTRPLAVIRDGEAVVGLQVIEGDENRSVLACDWVVEAIGQEKHAVLLEAGIELDEKGKVVVDPNTRRTSQIRVYAGGDCINGGKEVVNAAEDGREAAFAMLRTWGVNPC